MTILRIARVLVATLLVFSPPLGAQAPATAAIAAGIVWWPADPAEAIDARHSRLEDCLAARIVEVAPEIALTRQSVVRDALFPLLQPATQPATEEAFAELLARHDVRARLAQRGLRYLIAFTAKSSKAAERGTVQCVAGPGALACLGFAWVGETTAIDAAIWSIDDGAGVQHETARAEGVSLKAGLLLPVPIPARTQADACRELGTRIALAIRRTGVERSDKQ